MYEIYVGNPFGINLKGYYSAFQKAFRTELQEWYADYLQQCLADGYSSDHPDVGSFEEYERYCLLEGALLKPSSEYSEEELAKMPLLATEEQFDSIARSCSYSGEFKGN